MTVRIGGKSEVNCSVLQNILLLSLLYSFNFAAFSFLLCRVSPKLSPFLFVLLNLLFLLVSFFRYIQCAECFVLISSYYLQPNSWDLFLSLSLSFFHSVFLFKSAYNALLPYALLAHFLLSLYKIWQDERHNPYELVLHIGNNNNNSYKAKTNERQ